MAPVEQALVAVLLLAAPVTSSLADSSVAGSSTTRAAPRSPLHLDLEVDPTAFALGGYSAHVGIGWERLRLDLGLFAADIPRFLQSNKGFSASADGVGAKLQYFLFAEQVGGFVGIEGARNRQRVALDGTGLSSRQSSWGAGADVGWRFALGRHFHVTPWVGLDYTFGGKDVALAGRTYKSRPWSIYPFVHLGYRFQ